MHEGGGRVRARRLLMPSDYLPLLPSNSFAYWP